MPSRLKAMVRTAEVLGFVGRDAIRGQPRRTRDNQDPSGGVPVTITYTVSDGALTASGTPPGY